MPDANTIIQHLQQRLEENIQYQQKTVDEILTLWVSKEKIVPAIQCLKTEVPQPFKMLYDLFGIDERNRNRFNGLPMAEFTVVYVLFSFEQNAFIKLKVALHGEYPSISSITS